MFKHGEAPSRNGKHASPEYRAWRAMIDRCERPSKNWKDYGGRGIRVCKRWRHDFPAFLADMGRKPSPDFTLDRKNNNKGYSPKNCRWATRQQQRGNRRPPTPRKFCMKGLHRLSGANHRRQRCQACWAIWYQQQKLRRNQ